MKRNAESALTAWKVSSRRKPLIVQGARQVGKTHLIKHFAEKAYGHLLYLNFEEDSGLDDFFQGRLDPKRLLTRLSRYTGIPVVPGQTLVVLDEVQQSNRALNSLKYLAEEAPEQHVIAAGSLLGVQLSRPGSFPVGKVSFLDLHPMTFTEFLGGIGEQGLLDELDEGDYREPLPGVIHRRLLELLAVYYFVGGMPEPVSIYAETDDLARVRETQTALLKGYAADFGKHAPGEMVPKLNLIWESTPSQLARENKKFVFSALAKGARARGYEDALQWLAGAGLIHRCRLAPTPRHPLSAIAKRSTFKVYLHDVGLLAALAGVTPAATVTGEIFDAFRGAFVENYVAQQLAAAGEDLYYWRSKATAEIDFLHTSASGEVFPLEAKAGINPRSKSLRVFRERYEPSLCLRATKLNRRVDGTIVYVPLYAINALDDLVSALV